MAESHACAYILIVLLSFQIIKAKPFFGLGLWCGLLCIDDDYSDESYFDPCEACDRGPKRPVATAGPMATMGPTGPMGANPNQMSIVIPPSNGVNLTMSKVGEGWITLLNLWGAPSDTPGKPPATPAATAAPAATPAATTNPTTAATTAAASTEATTAAAARK